MLSEDQISEIAGRCKGTNVDYRFIVHFMIGYLQHAANAEHVRQAFFRQVQFCLPGKQD